jgi:uncharacterized integral membrane protein (TIGR00698 family)
MTQKSIQSKLGQILVPLAGALCLMLGASSALALLTGIFLALAVGNPYLEKTKKLTHRLLTLSVMGLGAGMNLNVIGKVGAQGIGYTWVGICTTLFIGIALGKILNTQRDTSLLITSGTAICGGSAIAAVAPTIGAKSHEVSVALGTVFLLNAAALLLFPWLGHQFHLTESQFGLWSALAIHDTSSVVGANLVYGPHALEVGTTVKLARALWIVPLTLAIGFFYARTDKNETTEKPKRPWFILGFLIAAALVTWIPSLQPLGHVIETVAKRTLVLTLFFIGTNLTPATLQSVGIRPLIQGVLLWIMIGSSTLVAVYTGLIQ